MLQARHARSDLEKGIQQPKEDGVLQSHADEDFHRRARQPLQKARGRQFANQVFSH